MTSISKRLPLLQEPQAPPLERLSDRLRFFADQSAQFGDEEGALLQLHEMSETMRVAADALDAQEARDA